MFRKNVIAAYLFNIWDTEPDVNRQLTSDEVSWYNDTSNRIIRAVTDLFLELPNVDDTEADIQWLLYEIGKRHFGTGKNELNFWFRCIYTIMFGTTTGPRIGTFIHIFGVENFLNRLEFRLQNPF